MTERSLRVGGNGGIGMSVVRRSCELLTMASASSSSVVARVRRASRSDAHALGEAVVAIPCKGVTTVGCSKLAGLNCPGSVAASTNRSLRKGCDGVGGVTNRVCDTLVALGWLVAFDGVRAGSG